MGCDTVTGMIMPAGPGVEQMDREECTRHLRSCSIGRIGYTANALPVMHPAAYVMDGEDVIVHAPMNSPLAGRGEQLLAFQIDQLDESTRTGWSVLVLGPATPVTRPEEIRRLNASGLQSWTAPTQAGTYIRIRGVQISGQCISHPTGTHL